jgi:hypothetical protein
MRPSLLGLNIPDTQHLFSSPWGRPALSEAELQQYMRPGCSPTSTTKPGEVCLLSVSNDKDERSALWSLQAGSYQKGFVQFIQDALSSHLLAQKIAARYLPLLGKIPPPARLSYAKLIHKTGKGTDDKLNGDSFGLSFCLAAASLALQQSVPANIAASAVLNADGTLGPVKGLEEKLKLLEERAFGVSVCLVFKEQQKDAVDALAKLRQQRTSEQNELIETLRGSPLKIIGVAELSDAFNFVWQNLDKLFVTQWKQQPNTALAAGEELFRIALLGSTNILSWDGVVRMAELAREHLTDPTVQYKTKVAADIARRHSDRRHELDWPDEQMLRRLNKPIRMRLMAHVIQSAADTDHKKAEDYLDRMKEFLCLDATELFPDELRLYGAMGRALSAIGKFDEACDALHKSLLAWWSLYELEDATYPLSELLRLLGFTGTPALLAETIATYVETAELDSCTEMGRAFVYCSAGRALLQRNQEEKALVYLRDFSEGGRINWQHTRSHLARAALRWRYSAYKQLGKPIADELYKQLQQGDDDQKVLSALERALENDSLSTAWNNLVQQANTTTREWGAELKRTWTRLSIEGVPSPEQAQHLLCQYRY